jgi:hypothetical protein
MERKKQAGQIERAISHSSINQGDYFLPACSTRKYSLEVHPSNKFSSPMTMAYLQALQQESLSKYSRNAKQQ